jgi:protein MpaA
VNKLHVLRKAKGVLGPFKKWMGKHITRKRLLFGGGVVLGTFVITAAVSFLWPTNVNFAYAGKNCFFNPTFLPNLIAVHDSKGFTLTKTTDASVGGYPLFSRTTCVDATRPPQGEITESLSLAPFGNPLIKKSITVRTGKLPTLAAQLPQDKPLSNKTPLLFSVDQADQTFTYKLNANNKQVDCSPTDQAISCDLQPLELAQSSKYSFTLQRVFKEVALETVYEAPLTTVEALGVTNATIMPGQKVFSAPNEATFTFTKPVTTVGGLALEVINPDGTRQPLPVAQEITDGKVVMRFGQALPRQAKLELKISSAESADNSYLTGPFTMPFTTSGGPQVTSINIGSSRVATKPTITITFDSNIGAGQPYQQFIQLETPAGVVASSITARANVATITPVSPLPACTPIAVKIVDGLKNDAGVAGGSAWKHAARTLCQTAFSIGSSIKGRSIMAYKFGGGNPIILHGGIHGNEKSSTILLQSLIEHLESNPGAIPSNHGVIIIPVVNPDGYATGSRLNANNVDLNRNFPASNWKSSVTVPGGTYPQGGGTQPLSEPESRALANFVASQGARLVLSYHAIGPLAAANEAGDSLSLARTYGQKAGIPSYGNDTGDTFDYDTTGAFDDWLAQAHGRPSILIELSTFSSNEFNRHRTAILTMLAS